MMPCRVNFSFDDGRADFWSVFEHLRNLGYAFTLNVTTGYVDKTSPIAQRPSDKEALSIEQIKQIAKYNLAEIALHGNDHNNDTQNIIEGDRKLRAWLNIPESTKLGYASCYSKRTVQSYLEDEWMQSNTTYMRASFRIASFRFLRVWARKIGHFIPVPLLFNLAYGDTIMKKEDNRRVLYCLPVTNEMRVFQLKALIKKAMKEEGCLIFMMHSICEDMRCEDDWSYPKKRFDELLAWIEEQRNAGKLLVSTTMDISRVIGTVR